MTGIVLTASTVRGNIDGNVDLEAAVPAAGETVTVRYGRMPKIVGNDEIATMLKVSKQRTQQLMDIRLHPNAPKGQKLSGGTFYLEADVEKYAVEVLGREKTW